MRYGVFILPDRPWQQTRPAWERAEQLGFDHAWTFDHLVWGGLPDSQWFSCIPTLTAAAAVTSRIMLGAFVFSPNFRHPVSLSREIQTLVDISDGRLLAGLGAGGTPDDLILGQSPQTPRERVDRLQEFARLLDRTLREDHVSAAGEYYSSRDMRLVGGSVRDRVPLLMAGNGPRSIRFAAAFGDGWVTNGAVTDDVETWFAELGRSREVLETRLAERPDADRFARYLNLASCPLSPLESIGAFDEITGRAAGLGFTDVILAWPRSEPPYKGSEEMLERIAAERL
ncbi:LLM class flavin-dependent oxidoreductase [Gordonia jinhuaensis]|uniref:Luciferase n=1 Tax=Gordonia jinhuaensis TaxID=1517702 RepID=A0A916TCM7_9ACTN|nr:LLM class flavin-dependent oxidoreductase [Gordonia jinhuaensis]GGB39906.1 luciferase [Gordonia jinhuaensis]